MEPVDAAQLCVSCADFCISGVKVLCFVESASQTVPLNSLPAIFTAVCDIV